MLLNHNLKFQIRIQAYDPTVANLWAMIDCLASVYWTHGIYKLLAVVNSVVVLVKAEACACYLPNSIWICWIPPSPKKSQALSGQSEWLLRLLSRFRVSEISISWTGGAWQWVTRVASDNLPSSPRQLGCFVCIASDAANSRHSKLFSKLMTYLAFVFHRNERVSRISSSVSRACGAQFGKIQNTTF